MPERSVGTRTVALVGPPSPNDNLAPYALYVTLWVGLIPVSLLLALAAAAGQVGEVAVGAGTRGAAHHQEAGGIAGREGRLGDLRLGELEVVVGEQGGHGRRRL